MPHYLKDDLPVNWIHGVAIVESVMSPGVGGIAESLAG